MRNSRRNVIIAVMIVELMNLYILQLCVLVDLLIDLISTQRKRKRLSADIEPYSMIERIPSQVRQLNRLVKANDANCLINLRMDRNTFGKLCTILKELGGLTDGRYVSVEEQIAMFVGILAHHKKNGTVAFDFSRSGQTTFRYTHLVLKSILKLHEVLLVKPMPVADDSNDSRWKWFKGCLGALDGTYINVTVSPRDKPRYRTRKGEISTNTLAVCDREMRFIYVLAGWEGSAADGRVLRDAVTRETGLRVPRGSYYLCDNGYANSDGFLTPYKGVRYHLKEWGGENARPRNPQELFNLRHSKARNVIERAFGVMKKRWGILRSPSFYPIKVQMKLVMSCFLLHNFIRREMQVDPIEQTVNETDLDDNLDGNLDDYVDMVEATPAWTNARDTLAQEMWDAYNVHRH